jgi:hypothetical protein
MKKCTKCGENKKLDQFYKSKRSPDGRDYRCKQCDREKTRKWYADNKEKKEASDKAWREKNREKYLSWRREYKKERYHNDTAYKITCNLRSRLHGAVAYKCASTMELVGCSIEELMKHIESQFTDGMSWENQGEWHIDHVRPCASFDLTDEQQQRECFHYTNLQPLWAEDNLRKRAKII